ncbi:MAG: RluA family pseudouridine synthase [Polyangiales bacterium]
MPRPTQPTLAAVVREHLGVSWNAARDLCRTGRAKVDGEIQRDPAVRVDPDSVVVDPTAPKLTRGVLAKEKILFVDPHLAVVNKPAGLLTIPYDDERDTLIDQLRTALRRRSKSFAPPLGIVHRLDKGTSGVLVFTRNLAAKRHLQGLFRSHTIERRYEALVHGQAARTSHESWLIANRGDGLRGSWGVFRRPMGKRPKEARWSRTHVKSVERFEGASLLTVELETGRQHQIRIHLSEVGHPIIGEKVYIRDYKNQNMPVIEAPRPMLHARTLGFEHPVSGEMLRFEAPRPPDFEEAIAAVTPGGGADPSA